MSLTPTILRGGWRPALAAVGVAAAMSTGASASAAGTCPNEAVREQQKSTYLPSCRGFEVASPANKNEQEVEGPNQYSKELSFKSAASSAAARASPKQ